MSQDVKYLKSYEQGVRISVLVQPKASKSEVVGPQGDALKIRVQAPPVEGRANEAVIELLADILDIPKSKISLMRGASGRQKIFEIQGGEFRQVLERLTLACD